MESDAGPVEKAKYGDDVIVSRVYWLAAVMGFILAFVRMTIRGVGERL